MSLGNRTYTTTMSAMTDAHGNMVAQVGDILTYSGRDWLTYVVANSTAVTTLNLTIHSSTGFTIFELDGQCGHVYRGVRVMRREGYMIASNADVFHSSDCARGATIEDSLFEANMDDFINIHSTVHVAWTAPNTTTTATTRGHALHSNSVDDAVLDLHMIQGRNTATSEPVNRTVVDDWYGTSSPMSSMAPGDTVSCWAFNSLDPVVNFSLVAWPAEVLDPTMLEAAAALQPDLNKPPTNAGLNKWPGLRLWKVRGQVTGGLAAVTGGLLPVAMLCDLDRFNNSNAVVRRNVFRHTGHPQVSVTSTANPFTSHGNVLDSSARIQHTHMPKHAHRYTHIYIYDAHADIFLTLS